jgi:hypothetical protein
MSHKLSSDILEEQFGPTKIEILLQGSDTRTICTKVIASGQVLEVSRVRFMGPGRAEFPDIHQEVIEGESMGAAFRNHRVSFRRITHSIEQQPLSANLQKLFDSNSQGTVVKVSIVVGDQQTPYAEIMETYSPFVAWPEV